MIDPTVPHRAQNPAGTRPAALSRRSVLTGLGALATTGVLSGCGLVQDTSAGAAGPAGAAGGTDRTITLIATESAPFQEPIKIAQRLLQDQGWELKPTYVTDIVQPNHAVSNGEFDANYFQHIAYLKQFNQDQGLSVEPSFYVYSSPAGLFSTRHASVDDLPDGARIALPVDPANNGRALRLLDRAGRLTVAPDISVVQLSQQHITANPHGYEFVEVDQQSLSKTLQDVDAGFLFVRLAGELGLTTDQALAFEEEEDAVPYRVVVAGRDGFAATEKGTVLRQALQSPEVKAWFEDYLDGALGTPWDADPQADTDALEI